VLVDYMDLAGTEVINSARAQAYATARGIPITCEPCPEVPAAVGDMPYWDLRQDPAPWFDPAIRESSGFLGVLGQAVAGFDTNPIERTPAQLVGDGAALGVLRRTHREIAYTVLLVAADPAALSYGLEWLASALRGSACAACAGDEMCLFASCPIDGTSELRHLYDVGLLDGPQVTATQRLPGGGLIATVTFALAAGRPFIFREPLAASADWVDLGEGLVVDLDPDTVHDYCQEPPPCTQDPDCPPPALPPRPPVPVDACYPTGVATFRAQVVSLGVLDQPQWLETVPLIEVMTGTSAIRRLVLRGWANPQGIDCFDVSDPCQACWHITIPYLPARSILTVDGRLQRAIVECPSQVGTATDTPTLYGPQGTSFTWPVFPCPSGLCVEVMALADTVALDARARVQLIPRSDMG
jgi:hypothetical protein